jgi:hypothetical protein
MIASVMAFSQAAIVIKKRRTNLSSFCVCVAKVLRKFRVVERLDKTKLILVKIGLHKICIDVIASIRIASPPLLRGQLYLPPRSGGIRIASPR